MPDIVGSILGKEKQVLRNAPSTEWILPDTTLGVEVELENVKLHGIEKAAPSSVQAYWEWHEDPSLHNAGAEFTFRNPLFGEDVKLALLALIEFSVKNKYQPSLRTGIHVHVDARDLSRHQLLGFLAYYTVYEPALYAWVGDDRHANNFCLPWYKFEGAVDQTVDILRAMKRYVMRPPTSKKSNEEVLMFCEQFHRYAGLNLKSLFTFGSIEFRQLKTTLDYQRIKDWINIILSLKRAAMQVPESTMVIAMDIRRRGIEPAAQQIFGERIAQQMWGLNPALTEEIREHSFPNAIELISAVLEDPDPGEVAMSEMQWNTNTSEKVKRDHPGFVAWRKQNYPKDLPPKKEDKPSGKGFKYTGGLGTYLDSVQFYSVPQGLTNVGLPKYTTENPEITVIDPVLNGANPDTVTDDLLNGYYPLSIAFQVAGGIPSAKVNISTLGYTANIAEARWEYPKERIPIRAIGPCSGELEPALVDADLTRGYRYSSIPLELAMKLTTELSPLGYRPVATGWEYAESIPEAAMDVAMTPPPQPPGQRPPVKKKMSGKEAIIQMKAIDTALENGERPPHISYSLSGFSTKRLKNFGYEQSDWQNGFIYSGGALDKKLVPKPQLEGEFLDDID